MFNELEQRFLALHSPSGTTYLLNLKTFTIIKEMDLKSLYENRYTRYSRLELTSNFKFKELLQKIPNIKEIYLSETNILFDDSWPKDLFQSKCQKLKDIGLTLENRNFDVEALATVMKKQKIRVQLYISSDENMFMTAKQEKNLKENLMKYFVSAQNEDESSSSILKIYATESFDALEPII
uniref:DUF38 domain-containing protein n=1 Tax=Panagrolaimus sp. ES5 TaxID=591445 RepID=A0AC34F7B6_9BILA